METEVSLESASGDQADDSSYWKLVIPRERILFVQSPGTEEFDVFLTALDEAMIVAMDAEWKPVRRAGVSPRVSILQISCRIRNQSEAWARIDRILLARRIKAEAEDGLKVEKSVVERQRGEIDKQREELEKEREEMQEEVEREKRKVRAEREKLKRERAEKRKRDKKERGEIEKARIASSRSERRRDDDDDVDNRPTLTKLQDGLKDLVLGRNGEISEVAEDLAGGEDVQYSPKEDGSPKKVDTEDAEQNMDNLLDVLAQAQKELMKHQEGEQHTLHTEAKLETLSKNEALDEEPESNYAFPGDKNLLEENGLRSRDTQVEENKVNRNFEGNDLIQDEPRRGEEMQTSNPHFTNEASQQLGDEIGETQSRNSNEQVTDIGSTGSGGEDVSDSDQEFSDAGENEFEVDKEVDEETDFAPELERRAGDNKNGVGLTEEESERSKGEEVIFVLDLLALPAAEFAFPIKKMLCSPHILWQGGRESREEFIAATAPAVQHHGGHLRSGSLGRPAGLQARLLLPPPHCWAGFIFVRHRQWRIQGRRDAGGCLHARAQVAPGRGYGAAQGRGEGQESCWHCEAGLGGWKGYPCATRRSGSWFQGS